MYINVWAFEYLDFKDHVIKKEQENGWGGEKSSVCICLPKYLFDMTIGGDAEV